MSCKEIILSLTLGDDRISFLRRRDTTHHYTVNKQALFYIKRMSSTLIS